MKYLSLVILVLAATLGCQDVPSPPANMNANQQYDNHVGQTIEVISYKDFGKWLNMNPERRIVSVCITGREMHGCFPGGLLIVSERAK